MLDLFLITTSLHIGGGNFNEFNPGLIARYEQVVVGGYKNSFSEPSYLLGWDFGHSNGDWEYGLIAGGVTGYEVDWTVAGITPFVAPYVGYDMGAVKSTVLVMGKAVVFSVGYSF